METVTPTTTHTKSLKRKLAEKLLAIAFLLFLLLLVFTFVGENDGENTFLSSFQKEHAKRHRERQRAINLAHHEDEEKTFHDILSGDEENERETFIRAHDEAVKVHSDDDDENDDSFEAEAEDGGSRTNNNNDENRFSSSKHPDLSQTIYEKLQRYEHSASAALVLKQQLASGKKCRESECAKIGKGGVPLKAINRGNPFGSLAPLCFQESVLDAKATEFGLSWDKKTTKDDWFVHRKTASEDSKFKMELLPESAKSVTKIMNRASSTSSSGSSSSSSSPPPPPPRRRRHLKRALWLGIRRF